MKQLTLLFLVNDSRVLLAMKKRGFGKGRWNGAGGKVEPQETIEQAMLRECQEEITVTPVKYYKGAELVFDEMHQSKRELLRVHAYICDRWDGAPEETEEMRPQWFKTHNLPLSDMWPADSLWLPDVLSGQKRKGKFVLDDKDQVVSKEVKAVRDLA